MQRQVDRSHYEFRKYVHKPRWASMWHQLDEVIRLEPNRVLEIGPGPGLFKVTALALGVAVETLDIDPNLEPDHIASVFTMPFEDSAYDVVCAFQVLEHLPFEKSKMAFSEMARVAKKAIVISLPDAATRWPVSIHIPMIGLIDFLIPKPRLVAPQHVFDGEHYWEINKKGYSLEKIINEFSSSAPLKLEKTYRVTENPYHRFFVFIK